MRFSIIVLLVFLLVNFAALGLGGLFTGKGVPSEWYMQLNKAPWTPPGWVFGFAWTTIMVCFSVYMTYLWSSDLDKTTMIALFALQWILNVGWNPTFFYWHQMGLALVVIVMLTALVAFFIFKYAPDLKTLSLLLVPYLLWLVIATSLNAYAYLNNHTGLEKY